MLILQNNSLIRNLVKYISAVFWNSLCSDSKMTSRGLNLDSNLNSATSPTGCKQCKGFICSQIPEYYVWSLNSF